MFMLTSPLKDVNMFATQLKCLNLKILFLGLPVSFSIILRSTDFEQTLHLSGRQMGTTMIAETGLDNITSHLVILNDSPVVFKLFSS